MSKRSSNQLIYCEFICYFFAIDTASTSFTSSVYIIVAVCKDIIIILSTFLSHISFFTHYSARSVPRFAISDNYSDNYFMEEKTNKEVHNFDY